MDLFVFAMLGGSIGWGSSRMMCVTPRALTLLMNVLAGTAGALLAGHFVVPLAHPVTNDFALAMPVALLGAVALVSVVTVLRCAAIR